MAAGTKIGRNVSVGTLGELLAFTVDPNEDLGPSKTGKSNIVASTGGFAEVPGYPNLRVNLTIIRR